MDVDTCGPLSSAPPSQDIYKDIWSSVQKPHANASIKSHPPCLGSVSVMMLQQKATQRLQWVPGGILPLIHPGAHFESHGVCKQASRYRSKHGTLLPIRPVCSNMAAAAGLIIDCAAPLPEAPEAFPPEMDTFPTVNPCPSWPAITTLSPFSEKYRICAAVAFCASFCTRGGSAESPPHC